MNSVVPPQLETAWFQPFWSYEVISWFLKVCSFKVSLYRYIGVWEGIRLHRGVLLFAREHLRRLYQGAKVGAISSMPGDFH